MVNIEGASHPNQILDAEISSRLIHNSILAIRSRWISRSSGLDMAWAGAGAGGAEGQRPRVQPSTSEASLLICMIRQLSARKSQESAWIPTRRRHHRILHR